MKYIIIPDNTPEEEVVLYHLRGNAISRADMINELTGLRLDAMLPPDLRNYPTASDSEIESTYNMIKEHINLIVRLVISQ